MTKRSDLVGAGKNRAYTGETQERKQPLKGGQREKRIKFIKLLLCARHWVRHFLEILIKHSHPQPLPIWWMKKLEDNRHHFIFLLYKFVEEIGDFSWVRRRRSLIKHKGMRRVPHGRKARISA